MHRDSYDLDRHATPRGVATVTVEVVTTRPQIEYGLMWRNHLPFDAGMLFVMGSDAVWSFYMRFQSTRPQTAITTMR